MGKLEQELRQTKPFASKREEAFLALQRTSDLVARPVERLFTRWKLTPEQYNVLRILRGAGPRGLATLEIGRRMVSRASNVTRIIDRLQTKKLADRHKADGDRRVVQVKITKKGLRLLQSMDPSVSETAETAMAGVSDREAKRLTALLEKVRGGIEKMRRRRMPPPRDE